MSSCPLEDAVGTSGRRVAIGSSVVQTWPPCIRSVKCRVIRQVHYKNLFCNNNSAPNWCLTATVHVSNASSCLKMQNVVQNSAPESVGNCVKHEVVLHGANAATQATSTSQIKSHPNSVPKFNHHKGSSLSNSVQIGNFSHKTVTVAEKAPNSASHQAELALHQVKQSRPYHQYMPDSSDSDSDDVLSVSCVLQRTAPNPNHLMILDFFVE